MDAAGCGKAALLGVSEGGPAAILFAATRPERTRALILTGATSYPFADGWDDLERDPAELRARVVRELGEDYAPSAEWIARFQEFGRAVQSAGAAVRHSSASFLVPARHVCSECWSACAPAPVWRERRSKRDSGPMSGQSCRRSLCRHSFSMPATTPLFRCNRAGISRITLLARAWLSSMARTTRPGSPIPTGSRPRLRSCLPAAMPHLRSHIAPCAPCCSRHGGQEHRRRPPGHVRRPDAGHPLRGGLAR